jgi:Tfp pilus assembly protein PilP
MMTAPIKPLVFASTILLAALAFAQQPAPGGRAAPAPTSPAEAAATPTEAPGGAPTDVSRPPLDAEMETGGYTYNSQGRRDPFVNLQRPVAADRGPKTRKPGMEGFLIQEVALKGIVKTEGAYIAMLLGTDQKSYFCKLGQRLFDGQIVAMDAATVTFRQDVTDPLSPVRTREVKKTLYPSEEARP